MSTLTRFLGDTPLRVALKLIVVSILVGLVMATFQWSPWDVLEGARDFFVGIWHMGFDAFGWVWSYFLLGAAVVIPAFIVLRILSLRR